MNDGVPFGKPNLNSSQRKLKYKNIWHLLTEHASISLSLSKFEEAFKEKSIKVLFVFRVFENSCTLRTKQNTWSRFCICKIVSDRNEKNFTIYQETKLTTTYDNTRPCIFHSLNYWKKDKK